MLGVVFFYLFSLQRNSHLIFPISFFKRKTKQNHDNSICFISHDFLKLIVCSLNRSVKELFLWPYINARNNLPSHQNTEPFPKRIFLFKSLVILFCFNDSVRLLSIRVILMYLEFSGPQGVFVLNRGHPCNLVLECKHWDKVVCRGV